VEKTAAEDKKSEETKAEGKAPEAKEVEKKAEEKPADKPETKEEDMNKQAQDAGKELANCHYRKTGSDAENEGTTGPGKLKEDTVRLSRNMMQRIQPMPGRNGTLNQMFDAVFARAKAMGPTGVDQMATGAQAGAEAKDPSLGTPSIPFHQIHMTRLLLKNKPLFKL
jgi:hypothetical protein